MSILTGKEEKREGYKVEDCLEEIQELRDVLELEQKARVKLEQEIKKCMGMYQECLDYMNQPEEENTEVILLKDLLEDERREHSETRKLITKLQDDMTNIIKSREVKPAKESPVITYEIQRDGMGRAHKISMVKT